MGGQRELPQCSANLHGFHVCAAVHSTLYRGLPCGCKQPYKKVAISSFVVDLNKMISFQRWSISTALHRASFSLSKLKKAPLTLHDIGYHGLLSLSAFSMLHFFPALQAGMCRTSRCCPTFSSVCGQSTSSVQPRAEVFPTSSPGSLCPLHR